MPYVLNPAAETGILEPLHVTQDEYDARCATLQNENAVKSDAAFVKPNKYGTRKAAQRVCDKINKTEVKQNGTE